MFSGIVAPGRVEKIGKHGQGMRLRLDLGSLASGVGAGDSVAVNGACLTVTERAQAAVAFDAVKETLDKTTLGSLREGELVNVELSLLAGDLLGGHFVLGHVDGVGTVQKREQEGTSVRLWIQSPLAREMVPKGSVALDGVSMTLVDVEQDRFSVAVIPYTLQSTTLGSREEGDRLNIELDILGKHVKKLLGNINKD